MTDDFLEWGDDGAEAAERAAPGTPGRVIEVDHAKAVKMIKELEDAGEHSSVHGGDYQGKFQEQRFDLGQLIWDAINGADEVRASMNSIDGFFPEFDVVDPDKEAEYRAKNDGELPAGYKYWVTTHARKDYPAHMAHFAAGSVYPERLFAAGNRTGKASSINSLVATPDGWVKAGDVAVGDYLIAGDGTPTRVAGVYPQGVRPVHKFVFDENRGESFDVVVDENHLWKVFTPRGRWATNSGRRNGKQVQKPNPYYGESEVIDTKEMIKRGYGDPSAPKYRAAVPATVPFQLPHRALPLDPYALGVLLAEGGLTHGVRFTSSEIYIQDRMEAALPGQITRTKSPKDHRYPRGLQHSVSGVLPVLRGLDLAGKGSGEKFIPHDYKWASYEQRLELLRGLMDCDGTISSNGGVEYNSTSLWLATDVRELAISLGMKSRIRVRETACQTGATCIDFRVRIMSRDLNPFSLPRKAARWDAQDNTRTRDFVLCRIEPMGEEETVCFEVEHPDHLYVTQHGIVTHNTVCGAYETALHLTGEYPEWWEGRIIENRIGRQNKVEPISGLAVGVSTYLLREVLQRELLGPPTEPSKWGTGMIRGSLIRGTSRMPNVAFGVEKILVEHISGTISELIMRPSDAGADRFAGTNHDFAWLDEKMDPKVYYEVMARVGATRGITYMTYTPVDGVNEIINRFMPNQFVSDDDKQSFNL